MPMMDISVALTNPYTLDVFDVLRREEQVGTKGSVIVLPTTIKAVPGVVHPAGAQDLERLSDDQRARKTIAVITKFALRGDSQEDGQNYQPDYVVWQGNNYVVMDVEDYSQYGPGFIKVLASITDMVATAPETK